MPELTNVTDRVEPRDAEEAARWLEVDLGASEREIQTAFRDLSMEYHPDTTGPNSSTQNFQRLQNARDMLIRNAGESRAERAASESRRTGPSAGPSSPFDSASESEQYEDTVESLKLYFIGEHLGEDLTEYNTVDEAMADNVVYESDIAAVSRQLGAKYGDARIDLDTFVGVVASLIVSGAINMGDMDRMAEESGFFTSGSRRGGEDSYFVSGSRRGRNDNYFQ